MPIDKMVGSPSHCPITEPIGFTLKSSDHEIASLRSYFTGWTFV